MPHRGLRLLLGLVLLAAAVVPGSTTGSSMETVHVDPGAGRIFLSPHLRWLEDRDGRLDLRAARRALAEGRFRRFHEDIPNFRYTNSVIWFHVRLRNDSAAWLRRLLEIGYSLLDDIRDRARYWGWSIGVAYGEPLASREEIGVPDLSAVTVGCR